MFTIALFFFISDLSPQNKAATVIRHSPPPQPLSCRTTRPSSACHSVVPPPTKPGGMHRKEKCSRPAGHSWRLQWQERQQAYPDIDGRHETTPPAPHTDRKGKRHSPDYCRLRSCRPPARLPLRHETSNKGHTIVPSLLWPPPSTATLLPVVRQEDKSGFLSPT